MAHENANCTRRLEFDAAHRVMRHESKCANLHGHRYVVDITVEADALDSVGRVVDFSVIKERMGKWIDEHLDHGTIVNREDEDLRAFCEAHGWKVYAMDGNPTAENLARLLHEVAGVMLGGLGVSVRRVRVYETPNSWSDYQ